MRSNDRPFEAALAALSEAFKTLGAPAMIIGGMAVIVRGVPRTTADIDAVVWGPEVSLTAVVAAMARTGIVPRIDDAVRFAAANQVLLLRHEPTGTPVDLSLGWLPFEGEALARATVEQVGVAEVRVATTEDLVILKAVAWRPRDQSDIEQLLAAGTGVVDLDRVRARVAEFAAVLEEPERVPALEALLSRSAPPPASKKGKVRPIRKSKPSRAKR